MPLRLEMPFVNRQVTSVRLARWHVANGGAFEFGAPLCDVSISEVTRLTRAKPRRNPFRRKPPVQTRAVDMVCRVIAAEAGVLGRTCASPGAVVGVGELIGIVTKQGETLSDDSVGDELPRLRVEIDIVDPTDEPQADD